jgi:hypothetical protein
MEKPARRVKKMAKKSLLNTSKPTEQAEKRVPAIPISISTNWRDEEERVDYEPEDPPCFSPHEDDISEPGDSPRTPVPGQADSSSPDYEFGGGAADDDAPMAGQKRRPNSPEDELRRKAPKTNWQPLSGEVVSPSPFSKTISSWQTHRGPLWGEVSPCLTKKNWQPLQGRVVSPSFLYRQPSQGRVATSIVKDKLAALPKGGGG